VEICVARPLVAKPGIAWIAEGDLLNVKGNAARDDHRLLAAALRVTPTAAILMCKPPSNRPQLCNLPSNNVSECINLGLELHRISTRLGYSLLSLVITGKY
jgi:hypothetical protein